MNKKYLIYAIVPVIACIAVGGVVFADTTANNTNPMNGIVTAIAQKFNLSVSDVQSVFEEQKSKMEAEREQNREKMQAEMQQKFTTELAQAVTDGKLTQAQADLITAKRAELVAQRPNVDQDALKQWASDNGISEEYLHFLCPRMGNNGGRGGPGGDKGFSN
jgi:hypothetical protein